MSDPGQGSSMPPDPRQRGGYQYPQGGPPSQFGPPPAQFGPPPWQVPAAPKPPLSDRLASTLDSWQKVVLACTALIVAIGGLVAALGLSHSTSSGGGAPQASSTARFLGIQIPASASAPTQATGLPAGCQQGLEVITTFEQAAGSTPSSEQNAAMRALDGIASAFPGASGVVATDLQILDNDFSTLYYAALEQNMSGFSVHDQHAATVKQSSSAFSSELAQINTDSQQFAKDCNAA